MGWDFGGEEMNLFELSAKLGLDSSEYETGVSRAESGLKTLEGAIKAFVAGYAVKKFIGLAEDAVNVGMAFDSAMSQVAATMGVSVEEIGELREFAKDMGANTAFSATQAAEALNYMALAGYDAEKSMKMLPTVLNLAAAGGFELGRASDMVTDAQSALGLSIEETTVMVNQMAQTAARSNTNVEQLGDAILTLGATGKFMAGGTDRLQTVLGLLADNGIKGSEAGTKLRNMLLKLSSPTKEGAALIEELGLEIFDAQGNMRDMQDIMLGLNEAMSSMTQEERMKGLAELFNSRDLAAVNALLGTSKERWDELGTSIASAQGSAEKMANTQLGNLSGDITLLKSAAEGAKIEFSEGLTPALRDVVQRITKVLAKPKTQKFLKEVGEKLGNIIKIIVEKAMVAIPRLISFMGTVVQSLKDNALAIGGVIVAVKALTNPVGAAVTAVGLLVGALALTQLTAQDVDEELANLSDSEKELVKRSRDAADAFNESMETYSKAVSDIDTEMESVQNAWGKLQGLVDENGKIAVGHEQEVQELLDIINEALGTQYEQNGNMIIQYRKMNDEIDRLIEKQWAQKLLEANEANYNLAKSQLEDAQKRLGIAKLERDTKWDIYNAAQAEADEHQSAVDAQNEKIRLLRKELDGLEQGTEDYNNIAMSLSSAHRELSGMNDEQEKLSKAAYDAKIAVGMQNGAYLEASAEVDRLVKEIGRYDEAYSQFLEGNYKESREVLEADIGYRWKHLKEGEQVSEQQLAQMKRDYKVLYAAYEDYREKLAKGEEGYNKEGLQRIQQQMLDLNRIVVEQVELARRNGEVVGSSIGEGVAMGLSASELRVEEAAGRLVVKAFGVMKDIALIHSPSRRGREIGANIGGSVGLGLEDSYGSVMKSAEDLTDGIFGALDANKQQSYVKAGKGGGWGEMLGVLRDIRDNIGNEIVLQDGTIVGWMDKQLGRIAAQKARGTA